MNQTRICNTCGIEKNIDLFCTDKRKPLGKTYKCKECRNNKDRVRIKEKRKNDTEWRDRYNTHSKRYHDKMKPIWKEQVIQDRLDKAIEDNASSSVFIRECNDCGVFDVFRQEPVANPNYCRECYYKYRNFNLFPIDYASQPRLRGRLTLRRLALRRNPWSFGVGVFHSHYRYSCQHSHF